MGERDVCYSLRNFIIFFPGFTTAQRLGGARCFANVWFATGAAGRLLEGKPSWIRERAKPKCLGGKRMRRGDGERQRRVIRAVCGTSTQEKKKKKLLRNGFGMPPFGKS